MMTYLYDRILESQWISSAISCALCMIVCLRMRETNGIVCGCSSRRCHTQMIWFVMQPSQHERLVCSSVWCWTDTLDLHRPHGRSWLSNSMESIRLHRFWHGISSSSPNSINKTKQTNDKIFVSYKTPTNSKNHFFSFIFDHFSFLQNYSIFTLNIHNKMKNMWLILPQKCGNNLKQVFYWKNALKIYL